MSSLPRFNSAAECEAAFYEAFRNGDFPAMHHAWGADTDVICIHPGRPPLAGRSAVMQSWQAILESSGGVDVRFDCRRRANDGGLAVHIGIETIGAQDGEPALVTVTNVYALTEQGWRMHLHHAGPVHRGAGPRGPVH